MLGQSMRSFNVGRQNKAVLCTQNSLQEMCNFTNRLFVIALLQLFALALAKPIRNRTDLIDLLYNDYGDYGYQVEEIHYDQRQKGEDNMRWRLDGFVFALPAREDASWLETLTDLYINNPLPRKTETGQNDQATTESNVISSIAANNFSVSTEKIDLEGRQQSNNELARSTRSNSQMVQVLKMFRRPQV